MYLHTFICELWLFSLCRSGCFFVLRSCANFFLGFLFPKTSAQVAPMIVLHIHVHPPTCAVAVHLCMHVAVRSLPTTTSHQCPSLPPFRVTQCTYVLIHTYRPINTHHGHPWTCLSLDHMYVVFLLFFVVVLGAT